MLVLLAVAAVAVLYCVVTVSQGRGGELTEFAPDVPPLDLPAPGLLTAVDFMALQLPVSLVGYHTQTVDETLQRAATALGERDTHIAVLEQRVAELLAGRVQARQEAYTRPSWAPGGIEHAEVTPEERDTTAARGMAAMRVTTEETAPSQGMAVTRETFPVEPETSPAEREASARESSEQASPKAPKAPEAAARQETPVAGEDADVVPGRHAASNGGGIAAGERAEARDGRGGIAGA
ncbi:hypothetical protein [Sphaerisporangium perillae]|uniref:hypothetical protein n=1 Tax=Sphaerisporangium perillae TaxID=2935860 RepID=UPI00200D5AEE|nr:hypothetical protein [Sphaerisporangium perillae]